MVVYSLRTLASVPEISFVVLVVSAGQEARVAEVVRRSGPWAVPIQVATGGPERQDSVAAGLELVDDATELVLVHDAARPFVSLACVRACVAAAATDGAAIAALAASDTVKLADEHAAIRETLDRRRVWLAQTPQVFRTGLLRRAYQQARHDGWLATDDAALVERIGHAVRIVPGEATNRKITTPDDLAWAEWHLQARGGTSPR
jgi:2-C-methyl-D-erythritol 4-phosphate cytidylyltransferase